MIRSDPTLHGSLLFAAFFAAATRPEVDTVLANYRTHWQLSLDGNQPAAIREHHRAETRRFQKELFFLLASLDCWGP